MAVNAGTRRSTSLETLIGYFDLTLRSEGKSPKTLAHYIGHLRLFLRYATTAGWRNINDIDAWAIREFLTYVRDPSNPVGTRQFIGVRGESRAFHHYKSLKAFFRFLQRERLVLEDPLENIRLRCPSPQNLPIYSAEELGRMERLCLVDFRIAPTKKSRAAAARNHAIFLVVLDTGLRLSELAGLQTDDVDAETGIIRVRRGKGGKGRLVRVGAEATKAVLRYSVHRLTGSDAFWLAEEGSRLTPHGIQQVFRRLCQRSGVKFKGVHAFRRNWCVASLRNGADLRMVQILGGWSTLAMPVHYSRTLQAEDALEVAARVSPVDHLLGKGKATGKK